MEIEVEVQQVEVKPIKEILEYYYISQAWVP